MFKTKTELWGIFRKHHYLSSEHHKGAECYIACYNDKPVAWCSVLHQPHSKSKNIKRCHRLVVLPDFQGVGIGLCLLNFVADIYKKKGFKFTIVTTTPALFICLQRSNLWRCASFNRKKPHSEYVGNKSNSTKRITGSFVFK